jgi:CheY-like chemotaxis protein
MLPGMSGIDVARQLYARGFGDMPMVAMSASDLLLRPLPAPELFHAQIGNRLISMNCCRSLQAPFQRDMKPDAGVLHLPLGIRRLLVVVMLIVGFVGLLILFQAQSQNQRNSLFQVRGR